MEDGASTSDLHVSRVFCLSESQAPTITSAPSSPVSVVEGESACYLGVDVRPWRERISPSRIRYSGSIVCCRPVPSRTRRNQFSVRWTSDSEYNRNKRVHHFPCGKQG